MHSRLRTLAVLGQLGVLFLLPCSYALATPRAVTPSLRQLAEKSGYIFAGTVMAIDRVALSAPGEVATVRITFRVDQAIRNVQAKQLLIIREWAGLWESGNRYRVGDRLVLFLYRPSKLGLTSTVGGAFGRFQLDARGRVLLSPSQLDELRGNPPVKSPGQASVHVSGREFADAIQSRLAP